MLILRLCSEQVLRVLLSLIFSLALTLPAYGEIYKWTDKDGTVNFTDAIDNIPDKYRKNTEKKNLPSAGITLHVRHVIDGDTVIATTGEKIRYLGIDAPEMVSEKNPAQYFAEESKMTNKKLVEGKIIKLEFDVEKTDRHGRLLAYVFLKDGTFVNTKLIEEGSARSYFIPPNIKYYAQFKKTEIEAMKNRKGVWNESDSLTPIFHIEAIRHIGKFRFVEGIVRNSRKTENGVYLNFGDNPDEDFSVIIFKSDYQRFQEKGINPASYYTGKKVVVYGKIKLYRGAEIVVSFPEDIKVSQ